MQHIWGLSIKSEILHFGRRGVRDYPADSARSRGRDRVWLPGPPPTTVWVVRVSFQDRTDREGFEILRWIILRVDNQNQTAQDSQGTQSQEGTHFTSNRSSTSAGEGAVDGEPYFHLLLVMSLLEGMFLEESFVLSVSVVEVE